MGAFDTLGRVAARLGKLSGEAAPEGRLLGYHGTPHTFSPEAGFPLGRFRADRIGSGVGAQLTGYGHNVTDNPMVAGHYAEQLAQGKLGAIMRYLDDLERAQSGAPAGRMYEVDFPDGPYLDLDAALGQQPEAVRAQLLGLLDEFQPGLAARSPNATGQDAVDILGRDLDPWDIAKEMQRAGAHGTRSRDPVTRSANNYAIFNGDDINIRALRAALLAAGGGGGAFGALAGYGGEHGRV